MEEFIKFFKENTVVPIKIELSIDKASYYGSLYGGRRGFKKNYKSYSFDSPHKFKLAIMNLIKDASHTKEGNMNQIIIELYPKTKDAVIVDKWFGEKINDPLFAMLLKGKEKELLEEANRLEKAQGKRYYWFNDC